MTADQIIAHITALTDRPLLLAAALALATLITEDGALIAGSLLVGNGSLDPFIAVTALVIGIAGGDVGLYGLGSLARTSRALRRRLPLRRIQKLKRWLRGRQTPVLFLSRFLPGTRMPTYVGFGYLRFSLTHFSLVMLSAAIVWVSAMVLFVSQTQRFLTEIGGTWGMAGGAATALILIVGMPHFARRLSRRRWGQTIEDELNSAE
ncbi:DedA family protein [Eilatimonas milleporae]|uniref:Membrane protein DedA with SNARE-associated domain n=1 Tax=Eilatimonas milleporae TaxID=911205 RepID=A0A3M0CL75_9PROT|nr:VTT domain-containing protein [Eilatimonas milleporae]RMB07819.1 membrane protein DedA with SNARE-associated domain [Eilatimonas milleporae]